MNSKVKKTVKEFIKEFDIDKITYEKLSNIIKKQGYTIVLYNNILNDKNVDILLEALNLKEFSKQTRGFTYADSEKRFVFINKDLSEEEKLMVLSHEEGHIYCNHLSSYPVIGKDVKEEYEANEFSHYLLHQSFGKKIKNNFIKHKKGYIVLFVVLLLLISGFGTYGYIKNEEKYYEEYYITETGDKYHKKDCMYVKNKNNVRRMTKEDFESGKYEPCEICIP